MTKVSFTTGDGNVISMGNGPVTEYLGGGVTVTYSDGTHVLGDRYVFKMRDGIRIDRRRYPGEGNRAARRKAAKGHARKS